MTDQNPPGETQIVYLEPDDEIPTVIRRLREATASRVILVAPGRTRATSSAIAVRLLARAAREAGRELALVAEPAARSLATEAGIAAYGSVADAQGSAAPSSGPPRPRATIRVMRGDAGSVARATPTPTGPDSATARSSGQPGSAQPVSTARPADAPGSGGWPPGPGDETREVPIARPPAPPRRVGAPPPLGPRGPRRSLSRRGWYTAAVLAALLVAAASAVLPAATVTIVPKVRAIGPYDYTLQAPGRVDSGELSATLQGQATGTHVDSVRAKGSVVFYDWSYVVVEVPAGTRVTAGNQTFTTDVRILVPPGQLLGNGIQPGTNSTTVTAVNPGPDGNVAAGAIDTIADRNVAAHLRGFPTQTGQLVKNSDPLTGGSSTTTPEISQADVDGLVAALQANLATKLAARFAAAKDRVYVTPATEETASVTVPDGLVGTRGQASFQLTGSLAYSRTYAMAADLQADAARRLGADARAVPAGSTLIGSTVSVRILQLRANGGIVSADAAVSGGRAEAIDAGAVRERIAGRSRSEAMQALADLGTVQIDLWPPWVGEVPRLQFRVSVDVQVPGVSASPPVSIVPGASTGTGAETPSGAPSP
jgi:hypothetical protein